MKERADVVVAWDFAPVPESVKGTFQRPTYFVTLPTPPNRGYASQVQGLGHTPIRELLRRRLPNVSPTRVALLGFSESCHGVRNLLSSNDGGFCDAVIAIDGIHTPYTWSGKEVDSNTMLPWLDFAAKALINTRLFVDTYSSIVPPTFTSTEQTANWLWDTLTNKEPPVIVPDLPPLQLKEPVEVKVGVPPAPSPYSIIYNEIPWSVRRRLNGLVLLGCANLDKYGYADHIFQARAVLPLVITEMLAARWNAIDPTAPEQGCFLGIVTPQSCPTSSILKEGWEDEVVPLPEAITKHTGTATWGDFALGAGLGAVGALLLRLIRNRT